MACAILCTRPETNPHLYAHQYSISVSSEDELWEWNLSVTQVYTIAAVLPLLLVAPAVPALTDTKRGGSSVDLVYDRDHDDHRMSWQQRCLLEVRRLWARLWQFAQTSSVYEPAIVLYVVTVTQVENPAWTSYLENSLNFGDSDLGVLEILGAS